MDDLTFFFFLFYFFVQCRCSQKLIYLFVPFLFVYRNHQCESSVPGQSDKAPGEVLDRAVKEKLIAPLDTAALAHVLGGLGREFSRPAVLAAITRPPKETADAMAEIILRGIEGR